MARSIFEIKYSTMSFDEVNSRINNILTGKGFSEKNRNGEMIWKKGTGFLTAMQHVKVEYKENMVVLSAWIRTGIGNIGGKEMNLTGVYGALPKKSLMKVIMLIQEAIR